MKRIILALIAAMMICSLVEARGRTVTEADSLGHKKRVIELNDTVINGKKVTDTLSVMTYESTTGTQDKADDTKWKHQKNGLNLGFDLADGKTSDTIISVTAIVFVFGLPLFIIFTIFFFNYKNRKAKYRLAEQAMASGQHLPENFFQKAEKMEDIRSKGIKNIFLGIGLFIFLWAMTNFSIGCIGLLVMFTGFGQVVIHYSQGSGKSRDTFNHGEKEKPCKEENHFAESTSDKDQSDKQNETEG